LDVSLKRLVVGLEQNWPWSAETSWSAVVGQLEDEVWRSIVADWSQNLEAEIRCSADLSQ
jgi:hypothetical protein